MLESTAGMSARRIFGREARVNQSGLVRRIAGVLVCCVLCAVPVFGQSVDTGVLGRVSDASGGVIPGASVTIRNVATGVEQQVVTGSDGAFQVRYLGPGEHVANVALSGFRTERRTFTLRVGQMIRLDVNLQVGDLATSVEVVATGQLIETQSGVTGNTVTSETLANLPITGRNFTSLGNLTAGVVASGTQFRASGARGMYQQVSFDGVSATNNRGNNLCWATRTSVSSAARRLPERCRFRSSTSSDKPHSAAISESR